ncbi:TetR/AcrR family transcriptional regulator [Kineosporia sp. NBRC 101731]|uniref:TetR/AcrR family transcriptional regulator n=1 Tax=Kineosporia sp. NBRC 101731 TaxID=3032199 RepID=UPI0024A2357D|nr:TetR/AcrR family transcriptional regulator [Kineosporia sp. NBRC 101731]GLY29512.1 TetR family transcriptional regulator [Kineosporia sp. NBRC 101731]
MPRVTEEYRAARRGEIISAAGELFARNGFHVTSMADIIAASGLSAGAVYRYFRSKEELIGAVAESALGTADEVFAQLLELDPAPSPAQAVTTMIDHLMTNVARETVAGVDLTRIALQVWAEAVRNPDLSARVNAAVSRLRSRYTEVVQRSQAEGQLPAGADPVQVGAVMLGITQGFLVQNLLMPGTSIEGYSDGVRALLGEKP